MASSRQGRLRILFVVPYTPSPVRVRPYNFIRGLARQGHEVSVLTLYGSESERAEAAALAAECHQVIALPLGRWRAAGNVLRAVASRRPLQSAYCWSPALAGRLISALRQDPDRSGFDVVHVEHLRGAVFGLHALELRAGPGARPPPVVFDSVDCISLLIERALGANRMSPVQRWLYGFDLPRTQRFEAQLVGRFARTLLSSEADREAVARLAPQDAADRLTVIGNGVDLEAFRPGPPPDAAVPVLVMSGKMSYHANVATARHLVERIMPGVWRVRPETRLLILGQGPPSAIRALARDPRIVITGKVEAMAQHLRQATVAVAPVLYGVGVQNKVLEAMACGRPVVASPQAVAGIAARSGRDLLVAEPDDAFATAILGLLDDPAQRLAIGAGGRRYVELHHDWGVMTGRLVTTYRQAIAEARG